MLVNDSLSDNNLETHLDQIQDAQLGFGRVYAKDKVQGGVVSIDEFVVRSSDKAEKEAIVQLIQLE